MGHHAGSRCMENNLDTFIDPACKQEPDGELGKINSSDSFHELHDQLAIITLIDPIDHYQQWIIRALMKSCDRLNNEFLKLLFNGLMKKIWVATQGILYDLLGIEMLS